MLVAVVPTFEWLEESFYKPLALLENTRTPKKELSSFYQYLQEHGMFRPSSQAEHTFKQLQNQHVWELFSDFERKYQKRWNGPDVPIYIFPVQETSGLFRARTRKSGVSFRDKIFFFLSGGLEEKEYEALFVHEYHHCTRMNKLKIEDRQYTLLDSVIFEGLAEYSVEEYCGEKYKASWTKTYSSRQLEQFWKQYIKKKQHIKNTDEKHNQLLLGKGPYPRMLGYCVGYHLIETYNSKKKLKTTDLLGKPSTDFIP
jgi:uncharacterized protein YjaZ